MERRRQEESFRAQVVECIRENGNEVTLKQTTALAEHTSPSQDDAPNEGLMRLLKSEMHRFYEENKPHIVRVVPGTSSNDLSPPHVINL